MSTTLISLPEELFTRIVLAMPQASYLTLSLACKTLHWRITPYLYHTVYYRGESWKQQDEWPRPRQTRIMNVERFFRTMSSSSLLRSHMRVASFDVIALNEYGDEELEAREKRTLEALLKIIKNLSSSISLLHICPLGEWPISPQTSLLVTSLEIDDTFFGLADTGLVERAKLHRIFTLPRLRGLTIGRFSDWGDMCATEASPCESYVATSNITSLSIKHCGYPGEEIYEILTWIKTLKSVHIHFANGEFVNPSHFTDALQPQRESLEELRIFTPSYFDRSRNVVNDKHVNLKPFPMLKRVSLPRNFVVTAQKNSSLGQPARIYDSLPPALEELEIDIIGKHEWHNYFSGKNDRMEESPGEMTMWLNDIVENKTVLYPNLRRVLLYHDSPRIPASYQIEKLYDLVEFKEEYEKAGILISHETKLEDTLLVDDPAELERGKYS